MFLSCNTRLLMLSNADFLPPAHKPLHSPQTCLPLSSHSLFDSRPWEKFPVPKNKRSRDFLSQWLLLHLDLPFMISVSRFFQPIYNLISPTPSDRELCYLIPRSEKRSGFYSLKSPDIFTACHEFFLLWETANHHLTIHFHVIDYFNTFLLFTLFHKQENMPV